MIKTATEAGEAAIDGVAVVRAATAGEVDEASTVETIIVAVAVAETVVGSGDCCECCGNGPYDSSDCCCCCSGGVVVLLSPALIAILSSSPDFLTRVPASAGRDCYI